MYLYHNSRELACRSPYGSVPVETSLKLSLSAQNLPEHSHIYLRLWQDTETLLPMVLDGANRYTAELTSPQNPGLLWYYFVIKTPNMTLYYGKTAASIGGVGTMTDTPPESWQITVYRPQILPEWYQNSVVYQIFPDRFHRGQDWQTRQQAAAHPTDWKGTHRLVVQDWNDTAFYCKDIHNRVTRWPFFGGTLDGIREKLSYLKSLGIGVLYLNPIFTASSNHKYDTADYMTIDPGFGDEESFIRLCREANAMGIHILLDGVFSHTGDDSIYFNRWGNYPSPGAYGLMKSPYDSWYRFGNRYPCGYDCWWGVDSLPEVDENDISFQQFICGDNGVVRKWLRLGASGWRLDVADELPDSFIASIRRASLAEKADSLLLGEVWEDASNKISYNVLRTYLLGEELNCTMHYPFRIGMLEFLLGKQTAQSLAELLETFHENYPPSALYGALNLIGTHDTPRVLTILGEAPENLSESQQEHYRLPDDKRILALRRLRLLQVLQFTSPGVPCVYYGDEAGMEGFSDPFNRNPFPWGKEDGDLTYWVRMLSHLRQEYPILVHGNVQYQCFSSEVLTIIRSTSDCKVRIYGNAGNNSHHIPLPPGQWLDLLTGHIYTDTALLSPISALVLYREGADFSFSSFPTAAATPSGRGLLCPVFSLPGNGTVGTMADALRFLPILKKQGFNNWMLLPLCPPGLGNSPYSSPSVMAGDPRLISNSIPVDPDGYEAFCDENRHWLMDFALYTALREHYGLPWQEWPTPARNRTDLPELHREHATRVKEIMTEQYLFYAQWQQVHHTATQLGISLIGDLPIYVSQDSADTWAHPEQFQLDDSGYPQLRAGCPPDYFSPEGQDWGNPLYLWDAMAEDGFLWWKQRLAIAFRSYDFVRLDHFRSFAAYYAISQGASAQSGCWMKGAGIAFFREMAQAFDRLPIIAEDLGTLDSQVSVLLQHTGLSGMNVWQFSQDEMATMPPEQAAHRVFFSGTHDNQTLQGFLKDTNDTRSPATILKDLLSQPAAAVIIPIQDILGLTDSARINTPGIPDGNWCWRMTEAQLTAFKHGGIL